MKRRAYQPSRAAVAKSLSELALLWRPPPGRESASMSTNIEARAEQKTTDDNATPESARSRKGRT